MDGNGRCARGRGLPRIAGHREGVKAAREIVRAAGRLGLGYLTLYAFSSENWSRPAGEVEFLMGLLESSIDRELPELRESTVRLRVFGRLEALAPSVRRGVERALEATRANSGLTLVIALNYGARRELVEAIRALARRVAAGELAPEAIDEARLAEHLDTRGVPDPDLLIRTSGEMRISNFLLWQIAYTELWVTPTLWPDFSPRDLYQAIADFQQRSRRFGGV
ncbi:MAG: di-trans,poly-cis-decaprenylcistransferase [Candidatus Rokubacteria bacterium]|nr:di-trans,poly-cis-decaprenylcistransferase [Candidatus Rokubacteria bacterium]